MRTHERINMPETVTPTPAPKATPTGTKATKEAERQRKATVDGFKSALNDAQSEVADAFGDVKKVVDAGEEVNLTPLMAAIDDLTAAVGDITAHGARNSFLSNEDSKALRDAQNELTQAFSDLRTQLEFPSMATDLTQLSTTIDNMNAAISGVASAKP
jgi:hypothetical protein